jgi:D-3-phosphoglycerate dehydrogenase / 2-oxoglutarate reductase
MRWKVLVSAPYMQPVIGRFGSVFEENGIELFVPPVQERFTEEDLLQWMSDVDGVISGDDRFTERVLNAAPRLKVISKWGTGIDSIDLQACRRLGIAVRNTPNAFSEPVADSVIGYILAFARNLTVQDRHMKQGAWQKIPGRSLRECTLGVIGVGNVGKTVVQRAAAFGMCLLGSDPLEMPAEFVARTGIRMVSKEPLLRQADFISLNCDLNPTSYHLINDETLAFVRPTAVLLNTARGPVVDEAALIKALKEKRLAGAALDVFEVEPLPSESPLRQMDNVLLAPHNANSSPQSWERVHQSTIKNLLEELGRIRQWNPLH